MKITKLRKELSRFRLPERGQAMLEFALMLPCLLLLSVGIVEMGRALYYAMETSSAASAGTSSAAQQPSVGPDTISVMQAAALADANMNGAMTATATYGCACDTGAGTSCTYPVPPQSTCATNSCSGQIAQCVQVTTHASFSPLFHYPGLPSNYEVNGRAVLRVGN